MKKMKIIFALLIALVMVFGMSTMVSAAEPGITIDNAKDGETYTAYKLLSATYTGTLGDDTAIAYYYSGAATDALYGLLTGAGLQFQSFVDGKAYLKVVDGEGNPITYTEAQIKTLAQSINTALTADPPTVSLTEAGHAVASSGTATISVADKGFYFVDTTLGSVCSIDTAGAATIHEKNAAPSLTKEVKEDTNSNWYTGTAATGLTVGVATAALDDTVNYRMTVNTGTNSYATVNGVDANYVIVDTLPEGMAYVAGSAATTTTGVTVNTTNAVWDATARTLTITLADSEVAALGQNADIVITYNATFTDAAVANTEYTNTAVLTYKKQTSTSTAKVKSYEFKINKVNEDEEALEGVVFTVSRAADGKYLNADGEWVTVATGAKAPELTTDKDGNIVVTGIDDDTYTVTEISTLDGYNMVDAPATVVVGLDGTATGDGVNNNTLTVVNYSGTTLPSTGGMGTTVFYIIGGILIVGAGIVLVARRRMKK